jgi:hypothetical protein
MNTPPFAGVQKRERNELRHHQLQWLAPAPAGKVGRRIDPHHLALQHVTCRYKLSNSRGDVGGVRHIRGRGEYLQQRYIRTTCHDGYEQSNDSGNAATLYPCRQWRALCKQWSKATRGEYTFLSSKEAVITSTGPAGRRSRGSNVEASRQRARQGARLASDSCLVY